ncbi:MAG: lysylphosphatidylglycerol synthase domain-containing protein [Planctomycetota bacterium]|jgi:uncharacterized membrane protein YbhN (UPF0104 family)
MTTDPLLHPEDDLDVAHVVEDVAPHKGRHPGFRWLAYVVGFALVAWCVYVAYAQTDWSRVRDAEPVTMLYLALLIVVSMGANAYLFALLTKPFEQPDRPVLMREWIALITASSLLNYLPKAGMLGRIAYLKKFHGVTLKANGFVLLALGAGTCGVYLLMLGLTVWRRELDAVWWGGLVGGLAFGTAISYPLLKIGVGRVDGAALHRGALPAVALWYAVRTLDTFFFAGRVYFAAQIFGQPVGLDAALAVGLARNFLVMISPIAGGLGLSEWGSATVSKLYGAMTVDEGIGVMLVDRATEVIVFVLTGLPAIAYLHKRSADQ